MPKQGHTLLECEDSTGANFALNRFAIADGATEAFDAGNWARRLTSNWIQESSLLEAGEFWNWLETEGNSHHDSWSELELPWYSKEKEQSGSYAAFVGIELVTQEKAAGWKAIALGDSCLVHFRDAQVIDAFPISDPASFGSAPILVPSRSPANTHAKIEISTRSGLLETGDELFLFSDAVAAWFLALTEETGVKVRSELIRLLDSEEDEAIAEFFEQQRSAGLLKNDDVAIIRISNKDS